MAVTVDTTTIKSFPNGHLKDIFFDAVVSGATSGSVALADAGSGYWLFAQVVGGTTLAALTQYFYNTNQILYFGGATDGDTLHCFAKGT